ncbi:TetR/AcrR family transcriptional regulator [Cupriavidus basilensis]
MAITAPSLYAAFGSKEQLFYEAVDRYADTHGALLYAPLQAAGGAREAVQGLLSGAAALFSAKGNPAGCFLMGGTAAALADLRLLIEHCRCANAAGEGAGTRRPCIQHGIARGELPAGTDTAALAKFYNTVMQGCRCRRVTAHRAPRWRAVAATAMLAWPAGPAKAPKAAKTAKSAKSAKPRETQTT